MILRDYQDEIIVNARASMQAGAIAPVVVLPTGGGKTIIFSQIALNAISRGKRVLILVHRREILEQTMAKLFAFGITAGQVSSGKRMTRDLVQVAMVGTLVNRLAAVFKPDLLIIDECHHAVAGSWQKITEHLYDVPRIGFTATPERLDGRGLGDVFDDMIIGRTTRQLVNDGFLARPRIFSSRIAVDKKYHIKGGDYDKQEQTEYMTGKIIVGDAIDHYRKFLDKQPCIVFCASIRHAEEMKRAYEDAGYNPAIISGGMNKTQRDNVTKGLADGTYHQLISCEVVSEGFDVPVVAGVQMLRKTQSLSLYLQQAGRALRVYEGKRDAIILDHVGNSLIHGHVIEERKWELHRGKRDVKKEAPPTITRCPSCFEVLPGTPSKCDCCGHDFILASKKLRDDNIKTISGELMEVMPDETTQSEVDELAKFISSIKENEKINKNKALWAQAYKLRNKEKIDALRKAMGYKPNWTRIVWEKVSKELKTA